MILTQQHLRRKRRFGRPRMYDNDSNRTWESMTLNGTTQGPQVTLSYDADQRMTSILRATSSTGPTITTNFAYDNADRVTTITHSSSSAGALATYLYSYDAASQLTQYIGPEGTLTYTYDLSGELTNVGNARLETYSYDLNGNRNYGSYTTASDNRLTADGTYTFGYDAEGNMTSKTRVSDGENWAYTWDDRNRLTQVVEKTSGGVTMTNDVFTYDVENRRIGKSVINGTQTWYGYDPSLPSTSGRGDGGEEGAANIYADFNGSGSLTMRYLTGKALDSLYARFDGTNTGWYLDDKLGSVRQVASTSGTVLDALTYNSYGQILSETNSSNGDRFKCTSREWDSEIAQYYYRARSYSPFNGRFASQDPDGFRAADVNLYRYVDNAPLCRTDPTGEFFEDLLTWGKQCIEGFTQKDWKLECLRFWINAEMGVGGPVNDAAKKAKVSAQAQQAFWAAKAVPGNPLGGLAQDIVKDYQTLVADWNIIQNDAAALFIAAWTADDHLDKGTFSQADVNIIVIQSNALETSQDKRHDDDGQAASDVALYVSLEIGIPLKVVTTMVGRGY
jgi:RHS repeat-associated protein